MEYIYAVSNALVPNMYKVGRHSGTQKKLISRYITAIPNVVVNRFVSTTNSRTQERLIHCILAKYRQRNANNNSSEWFKCDLFTIDKALYPNADWMDIDE